MTGTDLFANTPHDLLMCYLKKERPQPPPSLLLGFEPAQSCPRFERVMSEQKVPQSVEKRIVTILLVAKTKTEIQTKRAPMTSFRSKRSHVTLRANEKRPQSKR
ncbi:hypothetical protein AVEN_168310-1 [Araneus ventricosus]|uniref:Uncharacterized protein n=1 Tax=Araneus ventricosus TaxID=182803 RepID=A0A4Y2HWY4_ARAVE|nr:hypothetical protein AVEN_168310-1 [Araneus ventricosus]